MSPILPLTSRDAPPYAASPEMSQRWPSQYCAPSPTPSQRPAAAAPISVSLGPLTIWSTGFPDLEKGTASSSLSSLEPNSYLSAPSSSPKELYQHSSSTSSEDEIEPGPRVPLLGDGRGSGGAAASAPNSSAVGGAAHRRSRPRSADSNLSQWQQLLRSRSGRMVRSVLFGVVVIVFFGLIVRRTWTGARTDDDDETADLDSWDRDAASGILSSPGGLDVSYVSTFLNIPQENDGVIPFPSSLYDPLWMPRPATQTVAQKAFKSVCADLWISKGKLCRAAQGKWKDREPQLDVSWTWVNGSSDEPSSAWRAKISDEVGLGVPQRRPQSIDVAPPSLPPYPLGAAAGGKQFKPLNPNIPLPVRRRAKRALGATIVRHFREHDELRNSIRSILAAIVPTALKQLHLIVNDSPSYTPTGELLLPDEYPRSTMLAQVPHWVDLLKIQLSRVTPSAASTFHKDWTGPILKLHPLTELFKTPVNESVRYANESSIRTRHRVARRWRRQVLPSFNSLSVESQLANLPPDTSDTLLALCDDFFVMRKLAVSDVESPLTGPVLRFQRDLFVYSSPPDRPVGDAEGEWRGLGFTNWLLDQRFGARPRHYPLHVGKSISMPMLREVQSIFIDEMTATAAARFRGKAPFEAQIWFLLHHYTIEKHRESLLWSFFVARSDLNQDGSYSLSERQKLLSELGYTFDPSHPPEQAIRFLAPMPQRMTLFNMLEPDHDYASLPRALETRYSFTSLDGYAGFRQDYGSYPVGAIRDDWPRFDSRQSARNDASTSSPDQSPCSVGNLALCFPDDFLSTTNEEDMNVSETFKKLAFDNRRCGDCFIVSLLAKSGEKGMEAFLPDKTQQDQRDVEVPVEVIGGASKTFDSIDAFDGQVGRGVTMRQRAVSLISRYSYIIGDSTTRFFSMKYLGQVDRDLHALSRDHPALVALNDDIFGKSDVIDDLLQEWYAKEWPEPSVWEQQPADIVEDSGEGEEEEETTELGVEE